MSFETPNTARTKDPGSPQAALVALILSVLLVVLVAWAQHARARYAVQQSREQAATVEDPSLVTPPADGDSILLVGRMMTSIAAGLTDWSEHPQGPALAPVLGTQMDPLAYRPEQRVRVAITAGELVGADAAIERLQRVRTGELVPNNPTVSHDSTPDTLPPDHPLQTDIDLLTTVYTQGPTALDDGQRDRLIEHHGYFGELALAFDQPEDDPFRVALVERGSPLLIYVFVAGAVVGLSILLGFILVPTLLVLRMTGHLKPRFVPPLPGGSVYLEVLTYFVAAFIVFQLVMEVVSSVVGPVSATPLALAGQWSLLLVVLAPVIRGVPWSEVRHALGLHTGKGVVREVIAGFVGYLAGLPLYLAAVGMVVALQALRQAITGETPAPPNNPIFDIAAGGNTVNLLLVLMLATLWAPICEELVFRGALFRHLRGRFPWLVAGVASAVVFAVMHGYGLEFTPPLIALGITFAALREYRGSIIAAITAHFIHNAAMLTLAITGLRLLS